jgi:hypothetical protein
MGLRDQVQSQIESRDKGGAFLEEQGLYRIELTGAGFFDSKKGRSTKYWKLTGFITEKEEQPPEGYQGRHKYSPLDVGQEVVVIHNLSKDEWGYSAEERNRISLVLGLGKEHDWDVAGLQIVVEIAPKEKGKPLNVRYWYRAPGDNAAVSTEEMPF